ncbi:MAG TPA: DNA mismatch repair endonuclease MutL [Erysipelotrichaceae bacterium]|nr:DNA mismatch repair endonuclease MutL [Erysipelotrichia bacterium]HPX31898.1 DNA mismatch repair endonuclease MutL [Erysipelotrichaceae bacterium]HQA84410.1 DNA mismatch repair endonuclease MutL [Erysipelotrichaceae bacterium]
MSKIRILDELLSNMIAAGEVVERPMGVVKELVENSIDAQATRIEIRLINGGLDYIEITDDGCGMDKKDATAAFSRHATSKISEVNDLWQISTMGFRGEALPSIASVSKVSLTTNDGNDSTLVKVEYGKIVEAKPFGAPEGTTIKVEGLFYKTPARLKHLKSANVELNLILDLISKMALSHPKISFELTNDEQIKIQTNGSGSLQEVIMAIYGVGVAKKCIAIDFEDYDFKLTGYIVDPAITRATRQYINCFINGRIIKSYQIQKAIIEGYKGYLMSDRFPIAIVNIDIDYKLVDVNVHPSKWEIRISKERQLYRLITKGISEILKKEMTPSDLLLKNLSSLKQQHEQNELELTKKELYESYVQPSLNIVQEEILEYIESEQRYRFEYLAQLHGKYILANDEENLYIIDQHAAQERCMYEKIQNQIMDKSVITQHLLLPLVIEVSPAIVNQLDIINQQLDCIKLKFEQFSMNSIVTREVPDFFDQIDELHFIQHLINEIIEDKQMSRIDIRKEKIASLACHSSVRFNQYLSMEESKKLLERLSKCNQPFNCPHGRPTMIAINEKDLIKEFKRV